MRSRCRSLAAGLAALAGMLFLQVAVAFSPCELPGRSAALAQAVAMAAMPDCHEADQSTNLCLAHCASEDQSVAKPPQLDLPALAVPPAMPIGFVAKQARPVAEQPGAPFPAAGPPARIRYQSLLL
jgi:hypothetical protein